jgi:hypothetical protein
VFLCCQEDGLVTYFEDKWVKERERRTSIEKEIRIQESELYKSTQSSSVSPVLYSKRYVFCWKASILVLDISDSVV